jgi:hypothetical protein
MKNKLPSSALSTPARGLRFAVLGAVLSLAAGCSSLPQSAGTQLKDETQLAADPANENVRSYRAETSLASFGIVRVEPTVILPTAGALTPEHRSKLDERLTAALRKAATKRQPGPGEDVVITATVVAVAVGNPGANVPAMALLGLGVDMGGLIVELEARGATTGRRIAAAHYREAGKPWQFTANFSAVGHALKGADKAAERFGQLLGSK